MNILLISPYFRPAVGGVETHLDDLVKYLASKKHTVHVRTYKALGTKDRGKSVEENEFIKIHRFSWPDWGLVNRLEKYTIARVLYVATGLFFDNFLFLLKNHSKIDVVQVHGFIAALYAVPMAKIFRKRVVVNTHVGFNFDKKAVTTKITSFILGLADQVLVLTKGAKKALIDIGVDEGKIAIYHYWVEKEIFKPIKNARRKLGWGGDKTVLFVGRLVEVKGIDTLVSLAKKIPEIKFVIIGSGPKSAFLSKESKSLENLKFIGKVENNKLPTYYSASNVLLVPSKIIKQTYEEGIPRVIIESLYCGTPVITTPSGGIPDVFDSDMGIMARDTIYDIAKSLDKVLSKNAKDTQKTRKIAIQKFGLKNGKIIEESLKK